MTAREKWRQLAGMFRPKPGRYLTPVQMVAEFEAGLEANLPTRDHWIEVNVEFARIFGNRRKGPYVINVGQAPKDGTGDTGREGFRKIIKNLRRIPTISNVSPPVGDRDWAEPVAPNAAQPAGGEARSVTDSIDSPQPPLESAKPPVDRYAERNMT